jgi:hypothetical protein
MTRRREVDFSYNLLCNTLKAQVEDGFFFFLDSDDYIIPGAIARIRPFLNPDRALVIQMLRNGNPKPRVPSIERGRIGLPCIILHAKHKDLADVGGDEYSDYFWIRDICNKIPWKFLNVPLVDAGCRRYGK